jgi:hypothetical protein
MNCLLICSAVTKALLHARCKLKPQVLPVTSTTSQLKYNHLCIFDCILLSRPFVSIQPDVAFASLRLLKECKSIFTTVFSGCRLKNLIILFVAFSNGISSSNLKLSQKYFSYSDSAIFNQFKYSQATTDTL